MTYRRRKSKDKKYGTKKPRKPTVLETKANNDASSKSIEAISDVLPWIGCVKSELREMNENKSGRPYSYCQTMIVWLMALMGRTKSTVRDTVGLAKSILKPYNLKPPSRSTFQRRAAEFVFGAVFGPPPERPGIIAIFASPNIIGKSRRVGADSTGLNLSSVSLWRKNKWGVGPKYRGWLKLHALSDLDTGEIIVWALTEENVGDSVVFDYLYEAATGTGHRIKSVYADNAYDSVEHWKLLSKDGVEFKTRFRSNTTGKSRGCIARGNAAKMWIEIGESRWSEITGYGFRWKVECTFSDLKRMISEMISARSKKGWVVETFQNVFAFNIHKQIRADIMGMTGNGVIVAGN